MSTEPKIVDGLKVIELEPGAEVPPGVPAWAQCCDLVKTPNRSPSERRWLAGGGLLGLAVSLAALAFGWSGFSREVLAGAAFAALMAVLGGVWPGSHTVITPSESGRFLVFADGLPEPRSDHDKRVGCIASGLGVLAMLTAISALVSGDLLAAASLGVFGWWFYRVGRTGQMEEPDVPPATAQFLALADPRTPLPVADASTATPEFPTTHHEPEPRAGS